MIGAVTRGGGELAAWWGEEPDKRAEFSHRYPNAKAARSQDEVLHDPSVKLVLSSQIANQRAGIGVRAMQADKDFLSDKPGITSTGRPGAGAPDHSGDADASTPSCIRSGWK